MLTKIFRLFKEKSSQQMIKIAFNMKPKSSPWGGGNQFVDQLVKHLKSRGYEITYNLDCNITHIFVLDPRPLETVSFGIDEITQFKKRHPRVKCIHRINECDKRKNTKFMDNLLKQANEVADITVFISDWLKNYFCESWFSIQKPHTVIPNGADPAFFYPSKENIYSANHPFKIVTHHWSDNWMKGFKVYHEIDRAIASGELDGFELTIIGRWPKELEWMTAVTHPPKRGKELADLLRKNHIYITASLWEPCGMHHIEGAQCGLPLIYHEDGGGIVEYGKKYGLGFSNDFITILKEARKNYSKLRQKVLNFAPSGHIMCNAYEEVIRNESL